MLGDSLAYPRAGENWLKNVAIGGVLLIFGFLIIPGLFVQGYMVRVLRSAANDEREAPDFGEWIDLLVDGIKVLVVQIVYLVVPYILLFVSLFVVGAGAISAAQGSSAGAGIGIVGGVLLLVSILLLILAAYLVPAALANFAYNDDLGAAFDVGTVTDAAFSSDYFVALVLAIVVGLVLGTIAALLSIVLVGIFLLFYLQVSVYYLFGRGYAKGLDLPPGGRGGAADVAA